MVPTPPMLRLVPSLATSCDSALPALRDRATAWVLVPGVGFED